MSTGAPGVRSYLELALLQLGAESYLHNAVSLDDQTSVVNAWKFGFNDFSHRFIRDTLQATPDSARLPGSNRMVESQARDLFTNYEIVDHHANDATGFSATLFKNKATGAYTLSMRSTEARPWAVAGDAERDMDGAGTRGIYEEGFAFAQLAAMEDYWSHIRSGQHWDNDKQKWIAESNDGKLGAFREYMKGSAKEFYVTGYSLGAHLASVFTLLHAAEVKRTLTFNGAGFGEFVAGPTTGETIAQMLALFRQALLNPAGTTPDSAALKELQTEAIAKKVADGTFEPFATENGRIHQSASGIERGNIYTNPRYDYAEAYVQSKMRTKSLATAPLKAFFDIGPLEFLKASLGRADFAALGQGIQDARGSVGASGAGYDKILSISGLATHDDFRGVSDSQKHTANTLGLFIEDQPDVYGKGGLLPVNNTKGITKQIIENQNGGPGDYALTHSLVLLIDTMSLAAAIQQMSPDVPLEDLEGLMAVSSNVRGESDYSRSGTAVSDPGYSEHNSLENLLDALRRVLDPSAQVTAALRVNDDFGNFTNRTQFHTHLAEVSEKKNQGLELRSLLALPASAIIKDTPDVVAETQKLLTATDLVTGTIFTADLVEEATRPNAVSARAYRYALKNANPFVVLNAPYSTSGDLEMYDAAARTGELTTEWIMDRAEFLRRKLVLNLNNLNNDLTNGSKDIYEKNNASAAANPRNSSATSSFRDEAVIYDDRDSRYRINFAHTVGVRRVTFGGDRAEVITGGDASAGDRLYGGGGADYMEGRGSDDALQGGAGVDVYQYNASVGINDGTDSILDVDGKGVLRYSYADAEGKVLSTLIADASVKVSETQWKSADDRFTFTKTGSDLAVTIVGDAGGSMVLKDFRDGDFGIRLWDARLPPATGRLVLGDEHEDNKADVLYGGRPGAEVPPASPGATILAGLDNDVVYADRDEDESDPSLFGDADQVSGGEGRDSIEAGAGDDLVEAGADGIANGDVGGDIVDAGAGDDEVYAGVKTALADAILEAGDLGLATGTKGDFLSGGEGEDWLIGERADDLVMGGRGRDLIVGGAGDDNIYGDLARAANTLAWSATRVTEVVDGVEEHKLEIAGSTNVAEGLGEADVIYAGSGADWVFAGAGDDVIDAGTGADVAFGGAGDDIIAGGDGDDLLAGDDGSGRPATGNDVIDGGEGNDSIFGNRGDDVLVGGNGDDTLAGNEGADVLIGGAGRDGLIGGAGRDTYVFNRGDGVEDIFDLDDQLRDAAGNPIAPSTDRSVIVFGEGVARSDIKFRPGSLLIDLGQGDSIHLTTLFAGDPSADVAIDRLEFADGSVMMHSEILAQGFEIDGTDAAETIFGTAVSDRIDTRKGNDLAVGNAGADTYTFNLGDGQDTLEETTGGNVVRFGAGIASTDLVVGPHFGFDGRGDFGEFLRITYKVYPAGGGRFDPPPPPPDELFLRGGLQGNFARYEFADGISLTHAELMQRSGSVSVTGTDADEGMVGSNFADTLLGARGDDVLSGQNGDDQVFGGEGDDTLDGQDGNDTVFGEAGDDVVDGGAGNDQLAGDEGFDMLSGGAGSDQLFGGGDDDALDGGEGEDVLFGGADADELSGGAGGDVLNGDDGDDRLGGGSGDDLLQGGAGNDTYTVGTGDGADIIRDAEGGNRVLFGDGITAASLVLDQYIADDGTDFLSIGYSGGTLDIADGVLGRVAEFEFADGSVVEWPQLLAGAPALVVRGTEGAETLYGSNSADELLGGGGDDTLNGQGGDDFLSGGTGADALLGGAGDDTLSGNAGDDVLAGGTGTDTYRLGFSGGRDTVEEVAGESSILELEPGLFPVDLSAQRGGDDLVLRRRGTEEGITLKDYYVQPHAWTLKDGQGGTQDLAEFLAGAPGNSASHAERLRALAIGQFTKLLADRRYSLRADGKFHLETTETGFAFTQAIHRTADYTITSRVDDISENLAAGGSYASMLASRTETLTEVVVRAASRENRHRAGRSDSAPQTTPNFYPSGVGYSGYQVPVGSTTVQVTDAQGNYQGTWVYPEGTAAPGEAPAVESPGVTTVTFVTVREEYAEHLQLDELMAGDGANTISVSGNAIVDAGGGDDLIISEFANSNFEASRSDAESRSDGLFGNQFLLGSEFLFGGNGADTIYGSRSPDVLAGGEGHDQLFGEGGADVYYVDPNEAGIDLIHDEGGVALFYGGRVEGSLSGTQPGTPYANDFAAWEPAYGSPRINPDVVRFGPGIRPQDLSFSWGEMQFLGFKHPTLNIRWAADKGVDIVIPRGDDTIGSGIEIFEFDDGTRLTMREMIVRAPAHDYQYLDVTLGDGDDTFAGRTIDETVRGGAGNDTLLSVGDMDTTYEYWGHFTRPTRSGDDTFYGEAGDDVLDGGDGLDLLYGGAGADALTDVANGSSGNGALLDGGAGDDTLLLVRGEGFAAGGTGNDSVDLTRAHGAVYAFNRGDGADVLTVGNVTTISLGGGIAPGDVQLSSIGDELMLLELGAGDSIRLSGAPENFRLQFLGLDVRLQDLAGTELFASSTNAVGGQLAYDYAAFGATTYMTPADARGALVGGMLEAQAFARRIAGTPGDDVLSGGTGDDVFNPNGGVDSIADAGGTDTIVFGEGTSEGDVSLGLGSLTIRVGDGSVIHLPNFDPQDPFGAHDIERFRFADGTELSYAQLISRGFDLTGSDAGETINGTATTDRIDGRGSDDLMAGGFGSDTYDFGPGSGSDRIVEAFSLADTDVLRVAAAQGAVEVTRSGDDLVLALTQSGEQVAVRWFADPGARIERVQFSDGTLWDAATFEAQAGGGNTPPIVASPVADQTANEDEAYIFALPQETFSDPGDTLLLAASLDNGASLPTWLAFDATTRTFSGTPRNTDVGTVRINLIATDAAGASAIDSFDLTVANVNDAPFTNGAISDISVVEGQPVHYTVAAGLFADEDTDDALAYGMRLAGGGEIPDWLSFNSAARTLLGTTPMGQAGTVRLAATATDSHGEEAFLEFNLTFTALPPQDMVGTSHDDVLYGGSGNDTIVGRGGSDYANGGQGDDLVRGGNGSDILQGSAGDDVVRGGNGQDLVDGGAGADEVRGGALSDFFTGGTGDDVLWTGGGSDVIAFNRGDGWDLVHSDAGQNNTLSLGGGIRYQDLSLRKTGRDLVVDLGAGDAITLKGWYGAAGRESVARLQFVGEPSDTSLVSSFDFLGIVTAFDAARAATPGLTAWSISQALTQFHLASSDSQAVGGDLASYYAQMGSFNGLGLAAARDVLTAASFGQEAQALRPLLGLQEGLVRLGA